jgi:hypothetical protein
MTVMADPTAGEPLPHRTYLLQQIHVWSLVVGSAVIASLLACVFDRAPPWGPSYAYETMDGMRCLVEDGSETFVERADGAPECVRWPSPPTRIAASH